MERVQFQQEQMLSELKDLVHRGLFTVKETKEIMKKRTAFETALVRRVPKKADFMRYVAYETELEKLRRKRVERLKIPPSPRSVSEYSLVRRQFQIFERALKKFKADVGLWIQYVEVAKREGARALVGRITARALQLHPHVPALYILAAKHELDQQSPTAARTLLQRGLRLNSESVEMWRAYVRMELGFAEGLRRRWGVLGIEVGGGKGAGEVLVVGSGGEEEGMNVDEAGDDGEAARKDVLDGAIVKSVISSAAKAVPKIELFTTLQETIAEYPLAEHVRQGLVGQLYEVLRATLPSDPRAIKMCATRGLTKELQGEGLIDGLKRANEELVGAVCGDGRCSGVYGEFVEEWCGAAIDENLKEYLVSSLRGLVHRNPSSAVLLAAQNRVMGGDGGYSR